MSSFFLLENSDHILLESGDDLLLEDHAAGGAEVIPMLVMAPPAPA